MDVILDTTLSIKPTAAEGYVRSCIDRTAHCNALLRAINDRLYAFGFFTMIPYVMYSFVPTYRAKAEKHRIAVKSFDAMIRKMFSKRYDEVLDDSHVCDTEDMAAALIMQSKNDWNLENAASVLRSAITAGTHTSGNTMCFFVYEVARKPDIADAIFEEIRQAVDSTATKKLADVNVSQLKLLDACINESIRLHSAGPILNRRLEKDVRLGNFMLKKDSVALLLIQANHKMERLWDKSSEFEPERFMESHQKLGGPCNLGFAYAPFGYGQRKCPGESLAMTEMAIVLMHLCFYFSFELVNPHKSLPVKESIVLECQDLPVRFLPRSAKKADVRTAEV
ncbi:hypothetical protein HDU84_000007 [Entophlyctis sp. JEL0112]|nr:hypothetical protein HDU84_000007 [Entophlyctis sp. JEL0112]